MSEKLVNNSNNISRKLSDQELYNELCYVIGTIKVIKHLELSEEFKHELLSLIIWICKSKSVNYYIINMPNIVIGYRIITDIFFNIPEYYDDIDIGDYIIEYLKNSDYIYSNVIGEIITKIHYIINELYPDERNIYR